METLIKLAYLLSAVLFIFGLKGLSHPRTAVRANLMGASGMVLAVLATLLQGEINYLPILLGILVGGSLGALLAVRIPMTEMPQMVALLNGLGGLASLLVAGAALCTVYFTDLGYGLTTSLSGLIGSVTFTGSLVAFAKLQGIEIPGLITSGGVFLPHRHIINGVLAGLCLLLVILVTAAAQGPGPDEATAELEQALRSQVTVEQLRAPERLLALPPEGTAETLAPLREKYGSHVFWMQLGFWPLVLLALVLGVLLVIPIGGADMPVVIALLNSYSGLAAAMTGFVIGQEVLIITGSLVGASGLILTALMCKAMNRSLVNVLFARMGPAEGTSATADEVYEGKITATNADEIAMLLEGARRVVVVPGYGMAVAQAQHAVQEMARTLEARGTEVEYGIHPVAGRMPGHMNVLLAEAEVPYEKLLDMDQVNSTFAQTDVAIVIGANDVVNPVANTDPNSPIAGMPILRVDEARTVVVVKRSLSPGFAGIPNPLFAAENTLMYFADGKEAIAAIINALKENA